MTECAFKLLLASWQVNVTLDLEFENKPSHLCDWILLRYYAMY